MIIGAASPLRRLPTALNVEQALFFSAVRHTVEMIDLGYQWLVSELFEIGDSIGADNTPDHLQTSAVMHAWSLVDAANRLRVLAEKLPGFKQKVPPHQLLLRTLAPFEALRNPIQHLDSELRARAKTSGPTPVWGSLAWFLLDEDGNGGSSFLLIPGMVQSGPTHGFVNPIGLPLASRLDHVELAAYDGRVSLSKMHRAVAAWTAMLEHELRPQFDGHDHAASDLLVLARFVFDDEPEEPTAEAS